ncbi:hypothetical protein CEXT_71311 [Caerostris extrusa]|uniref:Uncharacterized protein n=1 Tax=Caerostris extrusa TaxID=172846 RepID=A0AAV4U570_CAEEX|nr:hypothetical protein CEXT_71311 [Caerostris extrusa]
MGRKKILILSGAPSNLYRNPFSPGNTPRHGAPITNNAVCGLSRQKIRYSQGVCFIGKGVGGGVGEILHWTPLSSQPLSFRETAMKIYTIFVLELLPQLPSKQQGLKKPYCLCGGMCLKNWKTSVFY